MHLLSWSSSCACSLLSNSELGSWPGCSMAVTCPRAASAAPVELAASAALTAFACSNDNTHGIVQNRLPLLTPDKGPLWALKPNTGAICNERTSAAQAVHVLQTQTCEALWTRSIVVIAGHHAWGLSIVACRGILVNSRTAVRRAMCVSTSSSLAVTSV